MKKFLTFTCNDFLQNKTRFLCTTSSGQDSTINFFLLIHAKQKKNSYLTILYCQHFWQTKNFFSVLVLYKLSFNFEIPYHVSLPQSDLETENQSRGWRKKIFSRVSKIENSLNLVTGQTLTDKSETMFQNLLRGTTSKGLSKLNSLNLKKTSSFFFSAVILKPTFSFYRSNIFLKKLQIKQKRIKLEKIQNQYKISLQKNQTSFVQDNLNLYFSQRKISKTSTKIKKTIYFFMFKPRQTSAIQKNLFLVETNYYFFSKKNIKQYRFLSPENINLKKNESLPFLIIERPFSSSFCLYSKLFKSNITLKKPLLETTRFTISKLRKFYDFPIINDLTNFSSKFLRNKIRYNLFPLVRYLFLPNFEFLLNHFLKTLENEQNFLKKDIEEKIFLLKNRNLKEKQYLDTRHKLKLKDKSNLAKLDGYLIQKIFFNSHHIELSYIQTSLLKNIHK